MKKIILFIFCLTTFGVVAACAKQPEHPEVTDSIVIGFSQLGNESTWRERNSQSVMEEIKNAGYKVLFNNAHQKQEDQIKAIRSFIASRVDLIVLAPVVETGWDTVLKEAWEAGIPVVLNDRSIQTDHPYYVRTLVGSDSLSQGQKAAEFLKETFPTKPVRIVEIQGTKDSSSTLNRHNGFLAGIKDQGNLEMVASEYGDFMLSKGEEVIRQLDAQYDLHTIDAIYSHNDDMTLGILNYLDKTDLKAGKDIILISVDAQQSAIDELKKGRINAVIECNPNTGKKLVETIKSILAGEEVASHYYLKEVIFTSEMDVSQIKERGY